MGHGAKRTQHTGTKHGNSPCRGPQVGCEEGNRIGRDNAKREILQARYLISSILTPSGFAKSF
jgi:hypothetical protein